MLSLLKNFWNNGKNNEKKEEKNREEMMNKKFKKYFGFNPKELRLNEIRSKTEVLIRLVQLAQDVQVRARGVFFNPNNHFKKEEYDEAFGSLEKATITLTFFYEDFANEIPHWTELPSYAKKWIDKKRENPEASEIIEAIMVDLK